MLARSSIGGDFQLGEWSGLKGYTLYWGSHLQPEAMNKETWNADIEDDFHPLKTFLKNDFQDIPTLRTADHCADKKLP